VKVVSGTVAMRLETSTMKPEAAPAYTC
jgi:hypothetical protein